MLQRENQCSNEDPDSKNKIRKERNVQTFKDSKTLPPGHKDIETDRSMCFWKMKRVNQETGVYRIKETENSAEKSGNGKFQNKQPCIRPINQLIHTEAGEWRAAGGKSIRDQKSRKKV